MFEFDQMWKRESCLSRLLLTPSFGLRQYLVGLLRALFSLFKGFFNILALSFIVCWYRQQKMYA